MVEVSHNPVHCRRSFTVMCLVDDEKRDGVQTDERVGQSVEQDLRCGYDDSFAHKHCVPDGLGSPVVHVVRSTEKSARVGRQLC